MKKENTKSNDGQNRCRRCDRPLSNPADIYGWRCAEIVGANNQQISASLDADALKLYNTYAANHLSEEKIKTFDEIRYSNNRNSNNWLIDAWNWGEDTIWKGIALGVRAVGWELSADLLWLAASGPGNNYQAPEGSYASNLAKNDVGINQFVNDLIWEYGTSRDDSNPTIPTSSYEIPLSNGDLGAALHNVKVDITANRTNSGDWIATVTLSDTFDFTEFKNPFKQGSFLRGFLWAANDIAYFDTEWELLDPVDVKITYTKRF